nr:plexin-C1-like [Misgurnus anguillicaudatus]
MRGNLLGLFFLLKYCMCDNVQNFDGDIRDFVVGNSKLYVLTDRRLHQMRHDLFLEKTKDFNATHPNVTLLVPFESNGTLITCGTSNGGYCEVLDLNDITNSIYWEPLSTVPQPNEKSIAIIVDSSPNGPYVLVVKKEFSEKDFFSIVTLWNTLNSQRGSIFTKIGDGDTPYIHITRDVEFIDGFQIILLKLSYLFLNAQSDYGWQAFALRLNNDRTKDGIQENIYGTILKCCNDKSRPVLVASALISSDKAVIWTGVFSAQNDPEDTALAVYNLSNFDYKLKDICSQRNKPCPSKNDPTHEPVAVVLKYKSMSSVAADRSESWIVLFIGTKDGQIIKVVLDEKFSPGCPTVLYRSDDDQKVLPRMHLDPIDNKHIYIALKNQIRRVPVVQCKHSSLRDCRAALDPLCGWCVETRRCSTQDECLISSWISFPNNFIQKPLLSFQVADKSSREMTLHLTLSLDSTQNPAIFSCTFTTAGVNLCDRSDPAIIFPNCSCDFSDQLLSSGGLEISATVTVENQKITETLMLKNCPTITENSQVASYAQCVQCVSAGCHWSSSVKRCDWTHGPEPQLHIQDVCKDLHSDTDYKEPEILSIEPNRVSFHGRNNVLLRGSSLGSVTKIRIQGDLDCFPKESPVFERSSDSLKFHVPPSKTKGTAKVCAVTDDDRCHGNSIITYSSQPSCTEIQPKVTWRSGGRKIHVQGNNMEFVESIIVHPSNKELKPQYNTSSKVKCPYYAHIWLKDLWFYTHPYDGNGLITLMLKVGNVILDCASLTHQPDPEFIGFTTTHMDNDVLVTIKKNADQLNLSMNEVKVSGVDGEDEYECVLEEISSQTITCLIKGALISVESVTIRVGKSFSLTMGQSSSKYLFCIRPQDTSG